MLTKFFTVAQRRFQFCTSLQEHLVMQITSAPLLVKHSLEKLFSNEELCKLILSATTCDVLERAERFLTEVNELGPDSHVKLLKEARTLLCDLLNFEQNLSADDRDTLGKVARYRLLLFEIISIASRQRSEEIWSESKTLSYNPLTLMNFKLRQKQSRQFN